ncbi:LysR family transcriptional regulator [Shewanella gaetbuli]
MDRLTAAKVFISVAKTASFTTSANQLNISRSMVTRYVETIENWLNARLLHRTTRSVTLTTQGEQCLPYIEEWIEQAERFSELITPPNQLKGTIRVACSVSFGFSQLAPAINAFMNQYPLVKIDVVLADSAAALAEQQIDLAIRITSSPDESLIGKPIAQCESVLVASPDYLALNKPIDHPNDLSQHRVINYKNFDQNCWQLTRKNEHVEVDISCQLTANEATYLLHACLDNAGIAQLPCYLANHYISRGQLIHVLPEWRLNNMQVYAFYASRKHLPNITRALIDHLERYFKSQ